MIAFDAFRSNFRIVFHPRVILFGAFLIAFTPCDPERTFPIALLTEAAQTSAESDLRGL